MKNGYIATAKQAGGGFILYDGKRFLDITQRVMSAEGNWMLDLSAAMAGKPIHGMPTSDDPTESGGAIIATVVQTASGKFAFECDHNWSEEMAYFAA